MNALLGRLKLSLRLSTDDFDTELQTLLNTAREDLLRMGVQLDACETQLGQMACLTYAKAHFDPAVDEFDRYMDSYRSMADELRKSGRTVNVGE